MNRPFNLGFDSAQPLAPLSLQCSQRASYREKAIMQEFKYFLAESS
jgi:hypothetical protein